MVESVGVGRGIRTLATFKSVPCKDTASTNSAIPTHSRFSLVHKFLFY